MDKNANVAIKECFDEAFDFKKCFAQVYIDDQFIFINTDGEFMLDLQFENVNDLGNGIYEFSKNGHKFLYEI
ncbi:WG repeat-containing protein [Campylobacter volucris]|uniref:WG repeat-containing protein n=1 Tax=Campylobacter volucris TaxID=1031542 RepID=UPI00105A79FF|nr:WG repeat-containing protein [Campylobacter volucris]MBF7046819.1 WG repeat-containing protein [Campylobacter volucris]TDJ86727.1 WG repeat-containing protein [Campylobacter volucris]